MNKENRKLKKNFPVPVKKIIKSPGNRIPDNFN